MRIQYIEYPGGKELLLIASGIDVRGWYRNIWDVEWQPFDLRILERTPVPKTALVDQKTL